MNPLIWSEAFHRASRETIGIALKVQHGHRAMNYLYKNRPAAYTDYTVCRTPDPNIIFIVKPGITLEDPKVLDELRNGGPDANSLPEA